jgi:hypothetical protein
MGSHLFKVGVKFGLIGTTLYLILYKAIYLMYSFDF